MRALVTGGAGYFGTALVQLLQSKNIECTVLDINEMTDRPAGVTCFQGDVRDHDLMERVCANQDWIFHNVAQVPLAKSKKLFDSVNKLGTEVMLKSSFKSGVKKVIYTSTSAVYGIPKQNPVTELTLRKPMERYGKSKLDGELLCEEYANKGLDVSIIRPRTILGPGRLGIFQILFEWIYQGYNVPVLGSGNNRYQFVHMSDLANLCFLAAQSPGSESYNCGASEFGTMREALQNLINSTHSSSKVKSVPMSLATLGMKFTSTVGLSPLGDYHALMYGRSMYFDTHQARSKLSWESQFSNDQMFLESYNWYIGNRERILKFESGSPHQSATKQGVLNLLKYFL